MSVVPVDSTSDVVLPPTAFNFKISDSETSGCEDAQLLGSIAAQYDPAAMGPYIMQKDFDFIIAEINKLLGPWSQAAVNGLEEKNCVFWGTCLLCGCCVALCVVAAMESGGYNPIRDNVEAIKPAITKRLTQYFELVNSTPGTKTIWTWLPDQDTVVMTVHDIPVTSQSQPDVIMVSKPQPIRMESFTIDDKEANGLSNDKDGPVKVIRVLPTAA